MRFTFISGALIFRAGFDRPNLRFELRQKPPNSAEHLADMAQLIRTRFGAQTGIVYVFSRQEAVDVAKTLTYECDYDHLGQFVSAEKCTAFKRCHTTPICRRTIAKARIFSGRVVFARFGSSRISFHLSFLRLS